MRKKRGGESKRAREREIKRARARARRRERERQVKTTLHAKMRIINLKRYKIVTTHIF